MFWKWPKLKMSRNVNNRNFEFGKWQKLDFSHFENVKSWNSEIFFSIHWILLTLFVYEILQKSVVCLHFKLQGFAKKIDVTGLKIAQENLEIPNLSMNKIVQRIRMWLLHLQHQVNLKKKPLTYGKFQVIFSENPKPGVKTRPIFGTRHSSKPETPRVFQVSKFR